jgi:hypothetical protein
MSTRKVIKQPTGKTQDRRDGQVFLQCPSCNSKGRFFEIPTKEPQKRFYRCHHCDDVVEVRWHKKSKPPEETWCDMFYVSTTAEVIAWGVSAEVIAWKEADERREKGAFASFLEQLVRKGNK